MNPGLLVGAGFLLGSVGVKALTSKQAKKVYVKGIVQGMRAKEEVETMVDEARAEFDDLLAEAGYVKKSEDGEEVLAPAEDDDSNKASETSDADSRIAKSTSTSTSSSDDVVKQVAKLVNTATKATGKGSGKGGHGHGRGGK